MRRLVPLLTVLAALAAAGPAAAATVSSRSEETDDDEGIHILWAIKFTAAPGEANKVTAEIKDGALSIADTGAPLTAGTGCTAAAGAVRCNAPKDYAQAIGSIDLGDGEDTITVAGSQDNLTVLGGPGADQIKATIAEGGDGNDALDGARLTGDAGDDTLLTTSMAEGGDGADVLVGRSGAQELAGGPGDDRLSGGAGADTLTGGGGRDALDGGDGRDVASWTDVTAGVIADLADPGPDGPAAEPDTLTAIRVSRDPVMPTRCSATPARTRSRATRERTSSADSQATMIWTARPIVTSSRAATATTLLARTRSRRPSRIASCAAQARTLSSPTAALTGSRVTASAATSTPATWSWCRPSAGAPSATGSSAATTRPGAAPCA